MAKYERCLPSGRVGSDQTYCKLVRMFEMFQSCSAQSIGDVEIYKALLASAFTVPLEFAPLTRPIPIQIEVGWPPRAPASAREGQKEKAEKDWVVASV